MTTSVDILFKELPAGPAAPERRNVSDIHSAASDRSVRDGEPSKNVEDSEKTFAEHLNEQPNQANESRESRNTSGESKTEGGSQKLTSNEAPVNEDQSTPEQQVIAAPAQNEDTKPEAIAKPIVNASKASQFVVAPVVENTKESASQATPGTESQNAANQLSTPQVSAPPNGSIENTVVESVTGSTSKSDEMKQSASLIATSTLAPAKADAAATTTAEKITNVVNNPANPAAPTLITDPTSGEQTVQDAPAGNNPAAPTSAAATTQQVDVITNTAISQPAEQTQTTTDNGVPVNAAVDQKQVLQTNADTPVVKVDTENPIPDEAVFEKKLPTETVAIEATRTVPVAPVPNPITNQQNSVTKVTTAANKSASKSAGSASSTSNSQSTGAAANANTGQAPSATTQLANAFKSDIQLDLGATGQRSEPAPLLSQPTTASGQMATSSLLSVQDVSLQKLSSSMPTTMKTDTPAMTRMINEQITVAINRHIVNGQNNFSIRLHPAELGQVDIRLEFAADGKMQASMVVENERTLAMLQRDQSALEKALQDAGINMAHKNLNFSLMKQGGQNADGQFTNTGNQSENNELLDQTILSETIQQVSMGYSDQAVDISV